MTSAASTPSRKAMTRLCNIATGLQLALYCTGVKGRSRSEMNRAGPRPNAQLHAQRVITRQEECPMLRVKLSSEHLVDRRLPLVRIVQRNVKPFHLAPRVVATGF